VVEALQGCAERTLPQEGLDFISEAKVVVCYDFIVALFIIIAIVVLSLDATLNFLGRWCPNKVDVRVV